MDRKLVHTDRAVLHVVSGVFCADGATVVQARETEREVHPTGLVWGVCVGFNSNHSLEAQCVSVRSCAVILFLISTTSQHNWSCILSPQQLLRPTDLPTHRAPV